MDQQKRRRVRAELMMIDKFFLGYFSELGWYRTTKQVDCLRIEWTFSTPLNRNGVQLTRKSKQFRIFCFFLTTEIGSVYYHEMIVIIFFIEANRFVTCFISFRFVLFCFCFDKQMFCLFQIMLNDFIRSPRSGSGRARTCRNLITNKIVAWPSE